MSFISTILFVFGLTVYPIYTGPEYIIDPNNTEILPNPINLQKCIGVSILEWRGNNLSQENIDIIDDICVTSIYNFEQFAKEKQLVKKIIYHLINFYV